jgi:hypothetical protein
MTEAGREPRYWLGSAVLALAALCLFFIAAQDSSGQGQGQGQQSQQGQDRGEERHKKGQPNLSLPGSSTRG